MSLTFSTRVLWKVIVGYFSASKKSPLRKCASRFSSRVLMLVASIVAVTEEAVWFVSLMTIVPSVILKCPRTVATIRCLTANSPAEWTGSIIQVLVVVCVALIVHTPFVAACVDSHDIQVAYEK